MINLADTGIREYLVSMVVFLIPRFMRVYSFWEAVFGWCIPRRHGNIMSDEFTPYPKNPLIQQFFAYIGRTDTIGSGVRNLYKYTPIYSDGGNAESEL